MMAVLISMMDHFATSGLSHEGSFEWNALMRALSLKIETMQTLQIQPKSQHQLAGSFMTEVAVPGCAEGTIRTALFVK
jgi:hypothetical protein